MNCPNPLRQRHARACAAFACLLPLLVAAQPRLNLPAPPNPLPFTLSVSLSGTGTGRVSSQAGGIDCGSKCSNAYSPGVPVLLNARGGTGVFKAWGGDCAASGSSPTCSLVMNGAKTVSARFERVKVVVDKSTEVRSAAVSSLPSGIDCGTRCTEYFDAGTRLMLQAASLPPGWFASFDGRGAPREVVLDKDVLQVRLSGVPSLRVAVGGSGRVTSQPAGIDARTGQAGSHPFQQGSLVNLRVAEGSVSRWACDSGAQANCQPDSRECTVQVSTQRVTQCTALMR